MIDLSYQQFCIVKKVNFDLKIDALWRSIGFGPNNMGPSQKGFIWSHLSPVKLDSTLEKKI